MPKSAAALIETLGPNAQGFSFALEQSHERVQLRALHRPDYGPIFADWLSAETRRRIAAGRKQLLARAVGLHKTRDLKILDATAGLGRDGYTLAALGAQVYMVERHAAIIALLRDAHARALACADAVAIAQRIEMIEGDAAQVFVNGDWDVIYLDPMYPHRGKTALPQKEMQVFRDLVGADSDADALLAPALQAARQRVVVKRADKAPWLAQRAPALSLSGSQARFDIYLTAATNTPHAAP